MRADTVVPIHDVVVAEGRLWSPDRGGRRRGPHPRPARDRRGHRRADRGVPEGRREPVRRLPAVVGRSVLDLAGRVTAAERTVRTGRPCCGVVCGLKATVQRGRLVRVEGDEAAAVTAG